MNTPTTTKRRSKGLVAKNQEELARTLGIHRRTLADYKSQGCPLVKTTAGYLIAPTAFWFLRREFHKILQEGMDRKAIPKAFHRALETILEDHTEMQAGYLKSAYGAKQA